MSHMELPATTRSARIDFLRGVAILVVLLLSFSLTYHLADSPLSHLNRSGCGENSPHPRRGLP
jgi:hypothetical protein